MNIQEDWTILRPKIIEMHKYKSKKLSLIGIGKTMDSHPYIVIDGVCKRVNCWMICCCFWFGCALSCEQYIYNVFYDYTVSFLRTTSRFCIEYTLLQLSHDIYNAGWFGY